MTAAAADPPAQYVTCMTACAGERLQEGDRKVASDRLAVTLRPPPERRSVFPNTADCAGQDL